MNVKPMSLEGVNLSEEDVDLSNQASMDTFLTSIQAPCCAIITCGNRPLYRE